MSKLHYTKVAAAVAIYAALLSSGKPEAEIREAISKDDEKYTAEQIDQIWEALLKNFYKTFQDSEKPELLVAEEPEWVKRVLESNQAVLDSNQLVIDGIESFKESAGGLVQEVINSANNQVEITGVPVENTEAKAAEVNPDAKYKVAKGKRFFDGDAQVMREEGFNVSKFAPAKIEALLSQRIIEEV